MGSKKKVTLSVDSKIYSDFQKYCGKNGVILSKKIEIFIEEFLKNKKNLFLIFNILFILLFITSFVSANQIFSDDFESGTLGGWTLTKAIGANDWTASTTDPFQGAYHAQSQPSSTSEPASVMEKTISTSGYSSIIVNYSRKLIGLDSADEFQMEWYDGTSWAILEQTGAGAADDASYVSKQFSLSAAADNNANFRIKFECTAGAVSEFCRVDNVNISGTASDSTPPSFSSYIESPTNASSYIQGQVYRFNVTITESNIAKVGIEFNGVNYTNGNLTNLSNVYIFNRTDLAAGTYSYYWWANDTNGNYGTSGIRYYTINKAGQSITSLLNGNNANLVVIYPQQINASFSGTNQTTVTIKINSTTINIAQNYTWGSGVWIVNYSLASNQNYSSNETYLNLSVNQATGSGTLLLNGTAGDILAAYPSQVNASFTNSTGIATLLRSGIDITSLNSQFQNLASGYYNFTLNIAATQNYSALAITRFANITKSSTATTVSVSPTSPITYGTASNFSCSNSQGLDTTLYVDGVNKTSEKGANVTRQAGTFTVNCTATANQNYTGSSEQTSYTINKAPLSASLLNSTSWTINYGISATINYTESNLGDGDVTYIVYRDNISKGSGESVTLGVGSYSYLLNTTGGQNYSGVSNLDSDTLIVNKAEPSSNMQIVLTPSATVNYGTQTSATGSETNTGDGGLVYNFYRNGGSIANPNTETLNAGTYEYVYNTTGGANYTSGSVNATLTVNQIGNAVSLLLNGGTSNLTLTYPQQINASASSTSGVVSLFRDGVDISSQNNLNKTLAVGFYEFLVNSSGNTNYLSNSTGAYKSVNISRANSQILLYLNHSQNNVSIAEGTSIAINSTLVGEGSIIIYNNGSLIYQGISPSYNLTIFSSVGLYNVTAIYSETQNYSSSSQTFWVNVTTAPDVTGPSLNITYPQSATYNTNSSLSLNFTASDTSGVDSCWYNINNGNNSTITNCQNTTFNVSGDGTYTLNLFSNDSLNNKGNSSVSFKIDLVGINLSITEPTGTKGSRTAIPINYNITGNNVTCLYNVKTSIGGSVIENTSLVNCSSSSFDVASDGDYIFNLYSNNSLGTLKNVSSLFSVSTSSGGGTGGGGGGGGGGGSTTIITNVKIELSLGSISDMLVNSGDSKKLSLNAKNSGTAFLNDCKLNGIGGYSSWISSSGAKSLNVGEDYDFSFDVNIPEQTEPGKYAISVSLECLETTKNVEFNVEIMEKKIGFNLIKIEDIGNNQIKISYSLEELSGKAQNVELQFLLFDTSEEKVGEIKEIKSLDADSKGDFETIMPVDKSLEGELNLLVNINSEEYSSFVEESVVLGRATGFAILGGGNGDKIVSVILIILFLVFAFFVIRKILMHKRRLKWFKEIRARKR